MKIYKKASINLISVNIREGGLLFIPTNSKKHIQTQRFHFLRNISTTPFIYFSLIFLLNSAEVQAMFGLLKSYTVEMSPEVSGRITERGKPLSGVQVARSLAYDGYKDGKEQLEHTITNENGEFSFTKMIIKSRKPGNIFGQNMPVMQAIYIERDDNLYQLWYTSKVWEPVKPLSDLLVVLNADLQNKEIHHEVDTREFGGMRSQVVISICYFQGSHITSYYNNLQIFSYADID